jgi:uncharacterized membrane protein YfcA
LLNNQKNTKGADMTIDFKSPESLLAMTWQRKRIRYWAVAVTVIVALLGVSAIFPELGKTLHITDKLGAQTIAIIFFAAMFCEFVDSSLGMGYGTTLTPMLLLAGFQPLQVVPCVLLSELATGLTAGIMHHRDGNVDLRNDRQARETLLMLSLLSGLGAAGAVMLAIKVPKVWLNGIIAVIIVSVGIVILATIRRQFQYRKRHMVLVGTIAAFNKGLSGGGYGPLTTAGQVVSGLSSKQAVAITSLAESITCAVGLTAYLILQNGALDLSLAIPMSVGALLSVPLATMTVRLFPEKFMRASVGITTCILGMITLAKALS